MHDLTPATHALSDIVRGVQDNQLDNPTPCAPAKVADLLDHVNGLSLAFAAAATKTPLPGGSQGPSADGSKLGSDWRSRIPEQLRQLADAWKDEDAWAGTTEAGGQKMPGGIAGLVAINEVVVHGWDIAQSTGQDLAVDASLVEAAREFVQQSARENPNGTPGLFGPPVPIGSDAPRLDQLVGLSGRDPAWSAASHQ